MPFGVQLGREQFGEQLFPLRHRQRCELNREVVRIAIDDHPRKKIGLAEDDAIGCGWATVEVEDVVPKADGFFDSYFPEVAIERLCFIPRIETNLNLALGIE